MTRLRSKSKSAILQILLFRMEFSKMNSPANLESVFFQLTPFTYLKFPPNKSLPLNTRFLADSRPKCGSTPALLPLKMPTGIAISNLSPQPSSSSHNPFSVQEFFISFLSPFTLSFKINHQFLTINYIC